MKKVIMALVLGAFWPTVQAYDGLSDGRITGIRVQSGRILVTQLDSTNPGQCPDASYLYLPQNDSTYHKNMYAALLAAYAAQTPVRLVLTGCTDLMPTITEVWVQ